MPFLTAQLRRKCATAGGTSLLELMFSIAVLGTLVVVSSMAMPPAGKFELARSSENLRRLIEYARSHAISSGRQTRVCSYDSQGRKCGKWTHSVQFVHDDQVVLSVDMPGISLKFAGADTKAIIFTDSGDVKGIGAHLDLCEQDSGRGVRLLVHRTGRTYQKSVQECRN